MIVTVDPRVELMSVLWRLAGRPEYNEWPPNARYIEEAEAYFAPFRGHPCVQYVAQVQQRWGAPMALAIHIADSETLNLRVPFDSLPAGIRRNWGPDGHRPTVRIIEEARCFVADTNFNHFIREHEAFYRETEARYRRLIAEEGHFDWFSRTFVLRPGLSMHIIVCPMNGGSCYPAFFAEDDQIEFYCFLGAPIRDVEGIPAPPSGRMSPIATVAHEFIHLLIDDTGYLELTGMREAGEGLLTIAEQHGLDMDAYGEWWCTIAESLANAWMIRYLLATHDKEVAEYNMKDTIRKGFIWVPELVELLAEYETNRNRYPNFSSFIPKLVAFYTEIGLAL